MNFDEWWSQSEKINDLGVNLTLNSRLEAVARRAWNAALHRKEGIPYEFINKLLDIGEFKNAIHRAAETVANDKIADENFLGERNALKYAIEFHIRRELHL